MEEIAINKGKLMNQLKGIHNELVDIYEKTFDFKFQRCKSFKQQIEMEYKNTSLDEKLWKERFCNRGAYILLNKILFVRICQDKDMLSFHQYKTIDYKKLVMDHSLGALMNMFFKNTKTIHKQDDYDVLNPSYESAILKNEKEEQFISEMTLKFEKTIGNAFCHLSSENFNFTYVKGNILGDAYQSLMDREARRSIGQFYTPDFIIDYILKNTVARGNVLDNPFLKVADLSCGSGHFLIKAYDILKREFLKNLYQLREKFKNQCYTITKNKKEFLVSGEEYWQEKNIHYHILRHCIYGADTDSFAVQLTTLNLMLKDLDNFTNELNIIQCDSLVKWERHPLMGETLQQEDEIIKVTQFNLLGEEETYEIKQKKTVKAIEQKLPGLLSDVEEKENFMTLRYFWSNRFDYVVGNPPYIGHKQLGLEYKEWLLENYNKVFKDKSDLYYCFFERILDVLSEKGISGIITPRYFMEGPTGKNLRRYMQKNCDIKEIVDFYGGEMFKGVGVATAIYFFTGSCEKENHILVRKLMDDEFNFNEECPLAAAIETESFYTFTIKQRHLKEDRWTLIPQEYNHILNKININATYKLSDVANTFQGIITGCDKAFVMSIEAAKERRIEKELLKPWIKNSNVKGYWVRNSDLVLIYADLIMNEEKYINSISFIKQYKDRLENRRECKNGIRKWYQLQWGRDSRLFQQPKIVFPYKATENRFAIDYNNSFCSADVYSLIIKDNYRDIISLEFLVGLLNSNIYEFYFKLFAKKMGKGMYDYYPNSVLDLKIISGEIKNSIEDNTIRIIQLVSRLNEISNNESAVKEDYIQNRKEAESINEELIRLQEGNDAIIADYVGLDKKDLHIIKQALNKKTYNLRVNRLKDKGV